MPPREQAGLDSDRDVERGDGDIEENRHEQHLINGYAVLIFVKILLFQYILMAVNLFFTAGFASESPFYTLSSFSGFLLVCMLLVFSFSPRALLFVLGQVNRGGGGFRVS